MKDSSESVMEELRLLTERIEHNEETVNLAVLYHCNDISTALTNGLEQGVANLKRQCQTAMQLCSTNTEFCIFDLISADLDDILTTIRELKLRERKLAENEDEMPPYQHFLINNDRLFPDYSRLITKYIGVKKVLYELVAKVIEQEKAKSDSNSEPSERRSPDEK